LTGTVVTVTTNVDWYCG